MALLASLTRAVLCCVLVSFPLEAQAAGRMQLRGDTLLVQPDTGVQVPLQLALTPHDGQRQSNGFDGALVVLPPFRVVLPHGGFTLRVRSLTEGAEIVFAAADSASVARRFRTTFTLPITLTRKTAGDTITFFAQRFRSERLP